MMTPSIDGTTATTTSVETVTWSATSALSVDGEDELLVVAAIPGSSVINDSAHTHLQLSMDDNGDPQP